MLQTKFHRNWSISSVEEDFGVLLIICGYGGHVGLVTSIV